MEKYVLPEKWCIQWKNKDNYKVINGYLNTIKNNNWHYDIDSVHSGAIVDCNNNYHNGRSIKEMIPRGYTLISFDQFREYVLMEKMPDSDLEPLEDYNYLIPLFKKLNIK